MTQERISEEITVLCVEDNVDVSEILQLHINAEPDMRVVGALFDATNLADEVMRLRPAVYVVDLTMPGGNPLDAVRTVASLTERGSAAGPRAIVNSGYDDPETVDAALNAGAWGFVSKHADASVLVSAIRRVARGEFVFPRVALSAHQ